MLTILFDHLCGDALLEVVDQEEPILAIPDSDLSVSLSHHEVDDEDVM